MSILNHPTAFVVLGAICVTYHILSRARRGSTLPLPPGPKGLPVIGNLRDLPNSFEWETYHRWSKELGTDILYLDIVGQSVIVLDTAEAATELLEKRSLLYSGRPRMIMVNELMGWNFAVGMMNYGEKWRRYRRLLHNEFQPSAAVRFLPMSLRAARNLLNRMLDYPGELHHNLKHMGHETIMSIVYGLELQPKDDSYIVTAEGAVNGLVAAISPGAFLVDALPFLKYIPAWIPGAGFKRKAREWGRLARVMVEVPFQATKERIANGTCPPCYTSLSLQKMEVNEEGDVYNENTIQDTAGALLTAGSDTTSTALSTCILGLLHRPDIVRQAQEELDRIILPGHLPSFQDEQSLPIITAIVKEALRWKNVTPMAIPHYIEVDDEYKGYRIPAGSVIIPNTWAMLNNEEVYPDSFQFKPERFLTKDGKLNKEIKDPEHACFGFGRRICPGRPLAFSSLWINIASLLYTFDIEKATDKDGNVVEPNPKFVATLVVSPEPYPYSMKARSKEFEKLIRANANLDIL